MVTVFYRGSEECLGSGLPSAIRVVGTRPSAAELLAQPLINTRVYTMHFPHGAQASKQHVRIIMCSHQSDTEKQI